MVDITTFSTYGISSAYCVCLCLIYMYQRLTRGDMEKKTFFKVLFEAVFEGLLFGAIAFILCTGTIDIIKMILSCFKIVVSDYIVSLAGILVATLLTNKLNI